MIKKSRKRLRVALIYNADPGSMPERPEDRGSMVDLRQMIRKMARAMRQVGYDVKILTLRNDIFQFQRKLRRYNPDVVFNQYEDVVHGALYEMRVAALVRMMGYPLTGAPPLPLSLYRYKFMAASLLQGAGVPVPDQTRLLERVGDVDRFAWEFPIIIQPSQEHAGIGLDRSSVVFSKKALKDKVRTILTAYHQPALVQRFLSGREFNVGILGGRRMRVLPLSEVDYSKLPSEIPPILSYAAMFIETSEEFQKTDTICPAAVEPELAREIGSAALRAFRALGGWGYGRVDVRLDEEGHPRILEVNCNPSLEPGISFARMAEVTGISYPQLLQLIINAAIEGPPHDVSVPMIPPMRAPRT